MHFVITQHILARLRWHLPAVRFPSLALAFRHLLARAYSVRATASDAGTTLQRLLAFARACRPALPPAGLRDVRFAYLVSL